MESIIQLISGIQANEIAIVRRLRVPEVSSEDSLSSEYMIIAAITKAAVVSPDIMLPYEMILSNIRPTR